jgi:hypothetical protein
MFRIAILLCAVFLHAVDCLAADALVLYKDFSFGQDIALCKKMSGFKNCGGKQNDILCRDNQPFAGSKWNQGLFFDGGKLVAVGLLGKFEQERYTNAFKAILNSDFMLVFLQSGGEFFDVLAALQARRADIEAEVDSFDRIALARGNITYTFIPKTAFTAAVAKRHKSFPEMGAEANEQRAVEMEIKYNYMRIYFQKPDRGIQKIRQEMAKQKESF